MMVNQQWWIVNVWQAAGALAMALWPVVWFASLSSWKYALGPEVSAAWRRRMRVLLSLASFGVGMWLMAGRLDAMVPGRMSTNPFVLLGDVAQHGGDHPVDTAIHVVELWSVGLLPVLAAALGVKLYEKWVNGRLSEAERRPGRDGFRAWLSRWNVVLIFGIAVCAWLGYRYSFLAAMLVAAAGVLAYPIMVSAMAGGGAEASPPPADLSPERERVLRLLEEGRVTAEEAAELLSALGATLPPSPTAAMPRGEPWTPGRRVMVIGAAIVLVGFFLPWFEVNLGREMRQMMDQTMAALPSVPMGVDARGMMQPGDTWAGPSATATIRVAGGDVGHGLGWLVLGLGIGATLTPVVTPGLAPEQRRAVMTVALAVGGVVLLYLLTGNLSRVSYGLIVVLVGYVLEGAGLLRDQFAWRVPATLRQAQAV
jgi:hypothetical protein